MLCPSIKPAVYRTRRPLKSPFHKLIRERFDDFRAAYAERYARTFGYWRPAIGRAVAEFLKCGDLQHGFARVRCPDCRHEFFVPFSCKQRCICPSCHQKRTLLFGQHVAEDVCKPVPHRQFVWTIPKRLRIFFRFHRNLLHRLPKLAWETITEVYGSLLGLDVRPGGIIAIQTFGTLIHFHPHLHALVTDGAFASDGRFLPLPANLTHEPFLRLWQHKVFRLLLDEGRIEPSLVAQISSWRHSGFNVDRSVRLEASNRKGIEHLAQYMARSPFSLARLLRITPDGKVIYRAEKDHCQSFPKPASEDLFGGISRNFQVFDPLDFIAEVTQHIPNKGEHLIRYYGAYSNKARKGCGRAAPVLAGEAPAEPSPVPPGEGSVPTCRDAGEGAPEVDTLHRARRRWAMLIQRNYEADPLLCPKCGGTMKVISFIEARQAEVLEKILRHCGLWADPPPRAPPPCSPGLLTGAADPDSRRTIEPDLDFEDFEEHRHRERAIES
ncbi:MAG: transposase [Planctomycetes bacterium]|nr:transposase [Planctomycetota bacterium]